MRYCQFRKNLHFVCDFLEIKGARPSVGLYLMNPRFALLDLVRGGALIAMTVYHGAWDISYFGLVEWKVASHPGWLWFRSSIIVIFLMLTGINLALIKSYTHIKKRRLWYRIGRLTVASALVSFVSYLFAPTYWVFFGVLHCIALAHLLLPRAARWSGSVLIGLAIFILLIDHSFAHPIFDTSWLLWVGLGTQTPQTLDYVPLIPWFGPILIGIFIGHRLFVAGGRHLNRYAFFSFSWNEWRLIRWLTFCGRHSLIYYLLHQPILIGLLYSVGKIFS